MPRESQARKQQRALDILGALRQHCPEPAPTLAFSNAWELLVATILSAQCTDEKVNEVTCSLFRKYPTIADYATADLATFEKEIYSTGFFQKKARSVLGAAQTLLARFDGAMPDTMEELLVLPGVARKTANVVLGAAFGKAEGIVVDTHVSRLSLRMGLTPRQQTKTLNTDKIERDLMELIPPDLWIFTGFALILHGRATCEAKKPRCDECCVLQHCPRVGVKAM